jgi:hypothetical protein
MEGGGREEMHTKLSSENLLESGHLKNQNGDGRIILNEL